MRAVTANAVACLMVLLWACTSEEPANSNGLACEGPDCVCEATTCSAHGNCVLTTEGALCICETGYGNTTCEGCAFGYARVDDTGQCAPRLSRTLPENAGDNCASGGVALLTGLDIDGNGNLDPSEVDETVYVCSASNNGGEGGSGGTSGQGGSGGTSGQGGTAGMDDDAGVSGDGGTGGSGGSGGSGNVAECIVDQCGANGTCMETLSGPRCYCETAYMGNACELCAPGYSMSSTRGCIVPNTLTVTEPEPAGTRCQHGGTRLRSGQDLNDNGTLDDNEATTNTFTCNTPLIRTGNVIVASRADLYDLLGVTEITGDLSITAGLITDLDPLNSLIRVGGTLRIAAASLTDLSGLNSLTFIGSQLVIENNNTLRTLQDLSGLLTIRMGAVIRNNPALTSINMLAGLEACGGFIVEDNAALEIVEGNSAIECGHIVFRNNPALRTIAAFPNLVAIGGTHTTSIEPTSCFPYPTPCTQSVVIPSGLWIHNNDVLTTLTGFGALTHLPGTLEILDNAALPLLDAFPSLVSTGAALLISNNAALTSVVGFDALTTVGRSLVFDGNTTLQRIDGFDSLVQTGATTGCNCGPAGLCQTGVLPCPTWGNGLLIGGHPALTTVTGFASLTNPRDVHVRQNPVLTTLPDLTLTAPAGSIRFENNAALTQLPNLAAASTTTLLIVNNGITDLTGIENIDAVTSLTVNLNANLTSFAGLRAAVTTLVANDNDALQSLVGMDQVASITSMTINDNASLTNFTGLGVTTLNSLTANNNASLTSFTGLGVTTLSSLTARDNPLLANLAGLQNVTRINTFILEYNATLGALTGYSGTAGSVTIRYNPVLPQCAALAFRTAVGATSSVSLVTGNNTMATCN